MLANVDLVSLLNVKFLSSYALGLLIILLYAKDKFNMPTYDREAMGPFAQLPPQRLTMDSRYRTGRAIYIGLLLCIYTAICIVGPTTFNVDFSKFSKDVSLVGSKLPSSIDEVWVVAAATFLISTGAAKDDSIFGRIELYIRQFAHKTAYIPNTVSDLAFSLRGLDIRPWLASRSDADDGEALDRRRILINLIGDEHVKTIESAPEQENEITAWARANILFYALQQILTKRALSGPRMDELTELEENKDTFERLRNHRQALVEKLTGSTEHKMGTDDADQVYRGIQRFAKDTSLMIAVLLSQAARNETDVVDALGQLRFAGIDLSNRQDHTSYLLLVSGSILLGAAVGALILIVPEMVGLSRLNWSTVDNQQGFIAIATASLVYLVAFLILDYSRDRLLDSFDWEEGLQSYVWLVVTASVLTSVVCLILIILVFSALNILKDVIYSPSAFALLFGQQFAVAALAAGFGLMYFREAARWPKRSMLRDLLNREALAHAACAALLVGFGNFWFYTQTVNGTPRLTYAQIRADFQRIRDVSPSNLTRFSQLTAADMAEITKDISRIGMQWTRDRYAEAENTTQLKALGDICTRLSKVLIPVAEEQARVPTVASVAAGAPVEPAAPVATGVGESLISGEKCEAERKIRPMTSAEDTFLRFAYSLEPLYQGISVLIGGESGKKQYLAWMFPAIIAFILAYVFGIACRHWRSWWLFNQLDKVDGRAAKAKDQIRKAYGERVDLDQVLVTPVASLNSVTALEALRYEDYRGKLLAQVQRRQIGEYENFVATKGTDRSRGPELKVVG